MWPRVVSSSTARSVKSSFGVAVFVLYRNETHVTQLSLNSWTLETHVGFSGGLHCQRGGSWFYGAVWKSTWEPITLMGGTQNASSLLAQCVQSVYGIQGWRLGFMVAAGCSWGEGGFNNGTSWAVETWALNSELLGGTLVWKSSCFSQLH